MSEQARQFLAGKVSADLLGRLDDETAAELAAKMQLEEDQVEAAEQKTTTEAARENGREPNVVINQEQINDILEPEVTVSEKDDAVPDWVKIPSDLVIPRGAAVGFLRFRSAWTPFADKGDRHCIVWALTDLDERVAYARIKDNFGHAINELSKQMIRAFDGHKVNWGSIRGQPGNVDDFLGQIGPKCRALLARWYTRTHQLDSDEVAHFLEHCAIVRTMG